MLLEKLLHLFRELINNDLLYEIILCIIVFLIFILFSRVFGYIVRKLVKPVVEKTKTQLDDIIVEIAVVGVRRLLILFGAYVSLMIFKNGLDIIEITSNKSLIQRHPYLHNTVNFIENSLFIIGTILFLFICGKLISFGLDWYAERTNANENKDLSGSLFPLFKKVAMLLLSMLAVAIVLAKFQIDISAFVVSLGVGSLAIALAAQDTISNMISGFIIMVDRPFRIGDRIKIGTEINGDVVLIGIRSTKILDFDKNFLIVPNNDIVKSRIINMTYPTNLTRVVVDFSIGYGEDLDRIKKIVFDIINNDEGIDKEEGNLPEVFLLKMADSALEMRLTAKTADYRLAFEVSCRLRENIYKKFNEEGIDFPFPHRDLRILKTKTEKLAD